MNLYEAEPENQSYGPQNSVYFQLCELLKKRNRKYVEQRWQSFVMKKSNRCSTPIQNNLPGKSELGQPFNDVGPINSTRVKTLGSSDSENNISVSVFLMNKSSNGIHEILPRGRRNSWISSHSENVKKEKRITLSRVISKEQLAVVSVVKATAKTLDIHIDGTDN
ncbi:hypothetical protein JTB14_032616 [Gonioctena quinquepunctata]|nr:hypothetical protein JTB14_032616 [Gonioctena quinquepunctata]